MADRSCDLLPPATLRPGPSIRVASYPCCESEILDCDRFGPAAPRPLEAGQKWILSGIVNWMRREAVVGIGAADEAFVGAEFATVAEGDLSGIEMGGRRGALDKRGGRYSLFYIGVSYGTASTTSAWIWEPLDGQATRCGNTGCVRRRGWRRNVSGVAWGRCRTA